MWVELAGNFWKIKTPVAALVGKLSLGQKEFSIRLLPLVPYIEFFTPTYHFLLFCSYLFSTRVTCFSNFVVHFFLASNGKITDVELTENFIVVMLFAKYFLIQAKSSHLEFLVVKNFMFNLTRIGSNIVAVIHPKSFFVPLE